MPLSRHTSVFRPSSLPLAKPADANGFAPAWLGSFLFPWGSKRELVRWAALLLMAFDHWAAWTAPDNLWLRLPGRVVFPIFALFMGMSLARGFSAMRYVLRILPFALLAQLGFLVFFWPTYMGRPVYLYWNILWTLLLGALFTDALKRRQWLYALVFLLLAPWVDYGIPGVTVVAVSTLFAESVLYGRVAVRPEWVFGLLLINWFALNFQGGMSAPEWALAFGAWLTVPFMWLLGRLPLGLPRGPWWVPYAFYPAHFVVLYALKLLF